MIKLLAVDDEPGICDILKKTFSPMGFTVLTATNGKDALSIVKKENPGIVFLDIKMLGMSGFEVLKEIKAIDNNTKVIMVTVMDDDKTRAEAKKLGADKFVTKPFISDDLERLVMEEIKELMRPRILIVDDEPDVVNSLAKSIFRKFNCQIEKAFNGQEALEKLKGMTFDLVITDIKMPGLSGIDIMKETGKFSPQTKFLAISAYDSKEVASAALEAGAMDFIPKPHTAEAIELKVKHILTHIGKYQPK